jgi:hypothetical protein
MSAKYPGEIPLTPEQEASNNWFWRAVRDANAHARALQDMSASERASDEQKLLSQLDNLASN